MDSDDNEGQTNTGIEKGQQDMGCPEVRGRMHMVAIDTAIFHPVSNFLVTATMVR